ncbi:MAG: hypothetical protein HY690_15885 [Chloroflexi bacterium]|nr:hypothetical protein [Chloroflexota bacterium]
MVLTVIALELLFVLLIVCLLCRAPYGVLGQQPMGSARRTEWRQAQERAELLLQEVLAEDEYRQLNRRGYLEVASPSRSRRTYRVPRHQGQVKVFEDGVPVMALCVQPVESIPDGDVVLMHKLMIEGNEDEYLRIANRFEPTLYGFIAIRPRGRAWPN